jgi:hypothetical protein
MGVSNGKEKGGGWEIRVTPRFLTCRAHGDRGHKRKDRLTEKERFSISNLLSQRYSRMSTFKRQIPKNPELSRDDYSQEERA